MADLDDIDRIVIVGWPRPRHTHADPPVAVIHAALRAGVRHDAWVSPNDNDVLGPRLRALGRVVEESAAMELNLRFCFCQLVGSKFAPVVAGGQAVDWLIGQCRALVDVHWEMLDGKRQAIKDTLSLCDRANRRRNVLMHSVKTINWVSPERFLASRSRRHTHVPDREVWTVAQIGEVADELAQATNKLVAAMQVSREESVLFSALAEEEFERRQGTT
jgi:hypothetical protein